MTITNEDRATLEQFAAKHGLTLEDHGEVGFGRPCVGFSKDGSYVDFNPLGDDYEEIPELYDQRLQSPPSVKDEYHKHDCLCVLVRNDDYDEALRQLVLWVGHYNQLGVEVVEYPAQKSSFAAFMTGATVEYAFRVVSETK